MNIPLSVYPLVYFHFLAFRNNAAINIDVQAFQVAHGKKNLPANERDTGDLGVIPGSGRSPGVGNGNPL